MTERETTRLCPECEESYLVEVREPGIRAPLEIYCASCGYTEDVDSEDYNEDDETRELGDGDVFADVDNGAGEEERGKY